MDGLELSQASQYVVFAEVGLGYFRVVSDFLGRAFGDLGTIMDYRDAFT